MKKFITFFAIIVITIGVSYCALWLYSAEVVKKEITKFYNDSAENLNMFVFYGDKPVLSGFPGVPKITYEGKLEIHNATIDAKKIEIYGFPVPFMPVTIEIDDKFIIRDSTTRTEVALDYLKGTVIIPKSLPRTVLRSDLEKWQKEVGSINLQSINASIEGSEIKVSGDFGLYDNLQPLLDLKLLIKGHRQIVNYFVAQGKLRTYEAGLLSGFLDNKLESQNASRLVINDLNPLEENIDNSDKYVEIRIFIKENRRLIIGPIRMMQFPRIIWRE